MAGARKGGGCSGRGGASASACAPSLFLALLLGLGFILTAHNRFSAVVNDHKAVGGGAPQYSSSNHDVVRAPRGRPRRPGAAGVPFHVVVTASSDAYSRWQCRIMYYWYKQVRGMQGCAMGGFTRVLSGLPDTLMEEMPTVVVDTVPGGDRGYIVLNRPWAVMQWLEKATIEEDYILMAEPDHIFVGPLPNLANGSHPAGFPFFYINATQNEKIIRKFYPEENGPVTNIDFVGSSPVIIHKDLLGKIAPTWMNISLEMKDDPEADRALGWVLEMYAYAVASALHGVKHILRRDFMVQPPYDRELGKAFIIHYTYGCNYNMKGEFTAGKIGEWQFDKRWYIRSQIPVNLSLPPPGVPETVVTLVKMLNEATAHIPGWESDGW